jgi:phosphate starvation-inducible protein PhoH
VPRKKTTNGNVPLVLKTVKPLTKNQKKTFDVYKEKNLLLHGWAGTGKTFLALFLALKEVLESATYSKIFIVRSAVPSRSIGYLPGSLEEKLEVFATPYIEIVNKLLNRPDGYEYLKKYNMIEFVSTSYLRGVTLENCVILVDEIQNMAFGELDTVITRLGKNIKMILAGDYRQTDLTNGSRGDILRFMNIINDMNEFECIEFQKEDIVRNDLVKSYLIAKENRPLPEQIQQ